MNNISIQITASQEFWELFHGLLSGMAIVNKDAQNILEQIRPYIPKELANENDFLSSILSNLFKSDSKNIAGLLDQVCKVNDEIVEYKEKLELGIISSTNELANLQDTKIELNTNISKEIMSLDLLPGDVLDAKINPQTKVAYINILYKNEHISVQILPEMFIIINT